MDFEFDAFSAVFRTIDSSLKTVNNMVSVTKNLKETFDKSNDVKDPELQGLVLSLADEVVNVKLSNVELKEQLYVLREVALAAHIEREKFEGYELFEAATGRIIYRSKTDDDNPVPLHYLCPQCKERGDKSILQPMPSDKTEFTRHACYKCKPSFFADV